MKHIILPYARMFQKLGLEIINENDEEYIMMYSLWNHI